MNEAEKRKEKKKKRQSWFERELMAYINAVLSQFVREAMNDIFKDFKL